MTAPPTQSHSLENETTDGVTGLQGLKEIMMEVLLSLVLSAWG